MNGAEQADAKRSHSAHYPFLSQFNLNFGQRCLSAYAAVGVPGGHPFPNWAGTEASFDRDSTQGNRI